MSSKPTPVGGRSPHPLRVRCTVMQASEDNTERVVCRFCTKFSRTHFKLDHFAKHVASCSMTPTEIREFAREFLPGAGDVLETGQRSAPKRPRMESSLPSTASTGSKQSQLNWDRASSVDQSEFNSKLAQFIAECGLPKNIAQRPSFKLFINYLRPALTVPSRPTVDKYVDLYCAKIQSSVTEAIAQASSIIICVDGKKDAARRHMTGFTVCTPHPFFFHARELEQQSEDAEAIGAELRAVIDKVGAGKVTAVVTDNTNVMPAAVRCVVSASVGTYRHIIHVGCNAHALNLVLKDTLTKISQFAELVAVCNDVSAAVLRSSALLKAFRSLQKADNVERTLMCIVETRWLSSFECIRRVFANRLYLEQLCESFSRGPLRKHHARLVSEQFYAEVAALLRILAPLISLLLFCERDEPGFATMLQQYQETRRRLEVIKNDVDAEVHARVVAFLSDRFDNIMFRPEMRLAGALHFDLSRRQWDDWVRQYGCSTTVLQYASLFSKPIDEVADEWNEFSQLRGENSSAPDAYVDIALRHAQDKHKYWKGAGKQRFPHLADVASRLLSIPLSSASVERAWKAYGYVVDDTRVRLSEGRAVSLVAAYVNVDTLMRAHPEKLAWPAASIDKRAPAVTSRRCHQGDLDLWLKGDMEDMAFPDDAAMLEKETTQANEEDEESPALKQLPSGQDEEGIWDSEDTDTEESGEPEPYEDDD